MAEDKKKSPYERLVELQAEHEALKAEYEALKGQQVAVTGTNERVAVLEQAMLDAMPTLDITRRNLPNTSIAQRLNAHYKEFRTLLGEKGEAVDRKQRGV